MNITRCKCSSLFQSNVCDCFSSSTIRDETTAGENTSSSLHSVVRKKNPELFYRVQSTHGFSPWTLSSKLQTSQCLIHTSCPAHSVSVLQQTFGCQCESLQRMLVNVGLHWLWGEHMTSLWRGFSFLLYTINRQNLNKEIKERDRRERQKMMEVETKQKADKETRIKSKWSVWIHMETYVTLHLPAETLSFDSSSLERLEQSRDKTVPPLCSRRLIWLLFLTSAPWRGC